MEALRPHSSGQALGETPLLAIVSSWTVFSLTRLGIGAHGQASGLQWALRKQSLQT